jgi:hypothetical protein
MDTSLQSLSVSHLSQINPWAFNWTQLIAVIAERPIAKLQVLSITRQKIELNDIKAAWEAHFALCLEECYLFFITIWAF